MEELMNSEVWQIIIDMLPSIGAVLATVISAVLAIRKVALAINEFRQSNELKRNTEKIEALLQDNEQLKQLNQKLLVELTRIKPAGWTDDLNQNTKP